MQSKSLLKDSKRLRKIIIVLVMVLAFFGIAFIASNRELKNEAETTTTAVTEVTEMKTTKTATTNKTAETTTKTKTKKKTAKTEAPETTTKRKSLTERLSEKIGKTHLGRFYITGYTAEEGFPEGSATASGFGCRPGICALNNAQRKELGIDYGETIYIDGLGEFTVADCGCAYGVVDVWCYTNAEAYAMTGNYEVYK